MRRVSVRSPTMGAATLRRGGWLAAASACFVVTSITAFANDAHAQPGGSVTQPKEEPAPPPAPPPPPTVTPPAIEKDEGAEYPEQAIRDKVKDPVKVVLVVVVDPNGAVKDATVETPQGHGFDEAAVAAIKKATFKPATRNGTPIAAKIKHQYTFTPPSSRMVGRVSTRVRDTSIAGATVTVEAADGTKQETTAGPDGTWRIEGLPAGTYKVTVTASGFNAQAYEQALDPGEEASIDMRLEREGGAPPAPNGVVEVNEVTVRGTRPPREVTKRTLEQRELNRIPGTGGDALRAIQNLPGVARPPAIAGLLIIRGAAPQETGTYVDGTFVPIIYHFLGLSSVVPTEMLDHIDFYPGNFSTYFGRHSGGVIDVAVKDPRVAKDKKLHGLAQVDLIDTRALVEGPIGNTGWSFTVAGRRSWFNTWLKPALEATGAGVTAAPVYYDYQAMLQRAWTGAGGARHNVRFFFFGSDDRFEILVPQVSGSNPAAGGNVTFGTAFYRMQARYVAKLSDDFELRLLGAVGKDALNFAVGDNFFVLSSYPISGRVEASQRVAPGVRNNLGLDVLYQPYTVDVRSPPPPIPGEPPSGPFGSRPPLEISDSNAIYRPAMYNELELTPFRGTRIVPGVRLDYTKENKSWDLQPRVNGRQDLTNGFPRTTVKGGVGRFANPPQPHETNPTFGVPGTRSMIANHYGAGIEQELTKQIEISSEAFYRQYDAVIVQRRGNVGEGRAFGLETLVRYKPDDRFFGFIAYTLSRSVRRDSPQDPERLHNFDQTHIFTAVGSYRLGGGWEIGARFRVVSGSMRNQLTYGFYDATVGAYIQQFAYPPFNERNPLFHQLDIRIDKTWILDPYLGHKLSVYLDLWNAYNQGNVEGVSYNYNHTQRTNATGLPIIPSIGVRVEL